MRGIALDVDKKKVILEPRTVIPAVHRRRTLYKRRDAVNKLLDRETIILAIVPPAVEVEEVRKFTTTSYPVCPCCGITLEREYQLHCDRCGQALAWNVYCSGDKTMMHVIQRTPMSVY